jgi:molecular chaperone DnaJ
MDKQQALELLGLPSTYSKEDIKQAVKKQVLVWHPDKAKSEEDKPKFEERFKQIKQAEELLTKTNQNKPKIKFGRKFIPVDYNAEIEITFDELMFGSVNKKITLTNNELCGPCDGTGVSPGYQNTDCNSCGGTGKLKLTNWFGDLMCNRCQGTGYQIDACSVCKGSGDKLISTSEEINIEPGTLGSVKINDHKLFIGLDPNFTGVELNAETGAVIVPVNLSYPEFVLGKKLDLSLFDGKKQIKLSIPSGIKQSQLLKLKQQGIPWKKQGLDNSLYVKVILDETIQWTDSQKQLFKQILNNNDERSNAIL